MSMAIAIRTLSYIDPNGKQVNATDKFLANEPLKNGLLNDLKKYDGRDYSFSSTGYLQRGSSFEGIGPKNKGNDAGGNYALRTTMDFLLYHGKEKDLSLVNYNNKRSFSDNKVFYANIGYEQVQTFQSALLEAGLNPDSMGVLMAVLHEIAHNEFGIMIPIPYKDAGNHYNLIDKDGTLKGEVVPIINIIRELSGLDLRNSYYTISTDADQNTHITFTNPDGEIKTISIPSTIFE